MQSPATTRASFSVDEETLDAFDDLADAEDKNRSEMLRELVEQAVGAGASETANQYMPGDETALAVYEACLAHAQMPDHLLRFGMVKGQIAEDSGVAKSKLSGVLFLLERSGYIRRWETHPMDQRDREFYRVKPRCADPGQWKYSRLTDRRSTASGRAVADGGENSAE